MATTLSGKELIAHGALIMMVGDEVVFPHDERLSLTLVSEDDDRPMQADGPDGLAVRVQVTEAPKAFGYWKISNDSYTIEALVRRITGHNAEVVYTVYRV